MSKNFTSKKKKDKVNTFVFVISSILVTLFLFFIDEGNYSFARAQNILSFLVLLIYAIPMIILQWFIFQQLPNNINKTDKYFVSIPLGILLGIFLVMGGFYLFA